MGLTIELSFDICKNANVTSIKRLLSTLAEKHNSETNYFIHEIEGHSTIIDRNDCVNIVEFEITDKINIINYIKDIIRIRFIKIDCIYQEDGRINIIYSNSACDRRQCGYAHTANHVKNRGNSRVAYSYTPNCKPNHIKLINGRHSHTSKNNILELVKLWGCGGFPH